MSESRNNLPSIEATAGLWSRAQGVLTAGLWSVSQGTFHYPDGVFPLLAQRGEGCCLVDTTGRTYVDWMMGWGPVVLGYRHPAVERAIREQLESGTLLSLLHPVEIEVAEAIRSMVPCAERVAFGKNGSDVLMAAVRIARAATGRQDVLVYGYHGFHDWYMAVVPQVEGIPRDLRPLVRYFRYNDLAGLRQLLLASKGGVAAVVMEPTNTEMPEPGFLEGVRDLTEEHGAFLIFDEIITGFRLANGGAQEYFGVVPDLACFGKGLSNGMPLSALTGKTDAMEILHRVGYGLTFRGELLSLAAARAALRVYREEPVCQHLWRIGDGIRERFLESARRAGVDARLEGPSPRMSFRFAAAGGITPLGLQTLFVQECLKRSILTNGHLLPSYAHSDAEVEETAAAFEGALAVLGRAIREKDLSRHLQVPALKIFYEDGILEESRGARTHG